MESNQYFIELARTVAKRSKDPSSKVGCVIVDPENRVVSTGYNGFIQGCDEAQLSWDRPMKYLYVIHAEANALLFARRDLKGHKAFISHGPCEACLKLLLQAGIRTVVYDNPSIVRDRGSLDQKEAIRQMIASTNASVCNINNEKTYVDEIYFKGESL